MNHAPCGAYHRQMNRNAFILLLIATAGFAQSGENPSFDVATIRPSQEEGRRSVLGVNPGNLVMRGYDLSRCLQWAYEMQPEQIEGPGWLKETRFDIIAKAADPVDEQHLRLMLRRLLEERFGLKLHRETRVLPVYEIVLAKDGLRLHDSSAKDASKLLVSAREGDPQFSEDKTGLIAEGATIRDICAKLSVPLGRPVVDKTGLTDRYDLRIDTTGYILNGDGADPLSLFFTAFEHQLGLKIVAGKDSVEFLVIDAVNETPTAN
ncbi:MAG TPA: TIGR03435 family protein [Terriglobales bacterium]|nr:TIGR03435 family protein [Terriglobales bacterium]